jgi:hypothetical protein
MFVDNDYSNDWVPESFKDPENHNKQLILKIYNRSYE